jgi:hypothetical protein
MANGPKEENSPPVSDKSSSASAAVASLETATNRIREAAKWLLAAFGAVGVVLVAGVALSDMSNVTEDPGRLLGAGLSVAMAVLGVVVAILAAGSIVTKSFVTLEDLATDEKIREAAASDEVASQGRWRLATIIRRRALSAPVTDPLMLGGFDDVQSLWKSYSEALRASHEALRSLYEHQGQDLLSSSAQKDGDIIAQYDSRSALLVRKAKAAANLVRFHDEVCAPLLARQSFVQVRAAYQRAKKGMGVGATVAVFGVLSFVALTSQPASAPVVGETPTQVVINLRGEQQEYLDALGRTCDLRTPVHGTAIATEGNTIVVAVPSTEDCREAILRLPPEDAVIRQVSAP